MKHPSLLILVVAAVVLASACQPAEFTAKEKAAIADTVRALMADSETAWNRGDIEGFMADYAQSDSTRYIGSQGPVYGWETVLERYLATYPDKADMGMLQFTDIDIAVLSADATLVFGKWTLQREVDKPYGWYTLLLRKTADGWKIVHDHSSHAIQD